MPAQEWPGKDPSTDGAKRLTSSEISTIIELHLNQVKFDDIAREVGCSKNTVKRHWDNYLDSVTAERTEHVERLRAEALTRMQSVAVVARRSAMQADTLDALNKLLRTELDAWTSYARVAGLEAPKVLQMSAISQPSEEEARATLAALAAETGGSIDELLGLPAGSVNADQS